MNHSDSVSPPAFPPPTTPEPPPPPPLPPQPGTSGNENIIYVQPYFTSEIKKPTHETQWSTSLFGCFNDVNTCCIAAICPCIAAGQIVEIVTEGKTSCQEGVAMYTLLSLLCMHSLYTCSNRSKMRKQHMLKGNDCDDYLAHTCCTSCALCQEYRELYRLGLDPGIGWQENIEREKHAVAVFKITPPLVQEGMMR